MRKAKLMVAIASALFMASSMSADEVAPYLCDFNTQINTNNPNFSVASNWKHIPESFYDDSYGYTYYMTYNYVNTGGIDGSGYLKAKQQYAGDSSSYYGDGSTVWDLIVTPEVKGTISFWLMIETGYYNSAFCDVYTIKEDGTRGTKIKSFNNEAMGNPGSNTWTQVTLDLSELDTPIEDYTRLGLRLNYMSIDNFEATSANIVPMKMMNITYGNAITSSGENNTATGIIYWEENENHEVEVKYMVKVKNTGEVDLEAGMEGYSVSVVNGGKSDKPVIFTVPVPFDLAVGEESEEFEVSGLISPASTVWPYSYSQMRLNLRENLENSELERANSKYVAYEPIFVCREKDGSSTSSISSAISLGMVSEATSYPIEIYNDGAAPLTITSVTVPEGFTVSGLDEDATGFIVAKKDKRVLYINLDAQTKGMFAGDITINYLDKNGDTKTFTRAISGNVIDPNAFICDFGTGSIQYPYGSFADSGISSDYTYSNTGSNYRIKGSTSNAKFYTPLLHAEEGDNIAFDYRKDSYSSSSVLRVYITEDRNNIGEPVLEMTGTDFESNTNWYPKAVTFPAAGDYYVVFDIPNTHIDNIAGPAIVENHNQLFIKSMNINAEKQSGEEITASMYVGKTATLAAADYTVNFYANDVLVSTVESLDITANAKETQLFSLKWTPEVEATTIFDTYVKIIYADGNETESTHSTVKVTCQPEFVFFDKGTYVYSGKPNNRTKTVDFGITTSLGVPQEFEIYNWGAAPLTVNSISVPRGYDVNIESCEVAPKERQLVTIALSEDDEPGTYAGNLEIKYMELDENLELVEKTYTLAISATVLDPSRWYADFNPSGNYPAGTVHESNVSCTNPNGYDNPVYAVYSYYTTGNMFYTPKLQAAEGDAFEIKAKLYGTSDSYKSGYVNVYAAETRDGLKDAENRIFIGKVSGKDVDDEFLADGTNWKTFSLTIPQTGDFYFGLELGERLYVASLYGPKKLNTSHDLTITSASIPATMMQNIASTMSVSLLNFGEATEAGSDYTVNAYLNGELVATAAGVDIPATNVFSATPTSIGLTVRCPEPGTFPAYIEVVAGDKTFTTATTEVTVGEEVFSAEKQVGEIYSTSVASSSIKGAPIHYYDKNSECVMLYPADMLGLNEGDRISKIAIKGWYNKSDKTTHKQRMYYGWSDAQTLAKPANGNYDLTDLIKYTDGYIDDVTVSPEVKGSKTETEEVFVYTFAEPLIYEAGKSLILYGSHRQASAYSATSTYGYEVMNNRTLAYGHSDDTESTFNSQTWTDTYLPVLHISLVAEPASVSGTVTDNGAPVEGAIVKLVSADGDNVQYKGTTDAEGNYSVNVIQNNRLYDVTASFENKEDYLLSEVYTESAVRNFSLMDVVEIDNTVGGHTAAGSAIVKLNLDLEPGFNTIVLPFSLTAEETSAIFGDDAIYYCGNYELLEDGEVRLYFGAENGGITAGKPYLVNVLNNPEAIRFRGKEVIETITPTLFGGTVVEFHGTYEAKPVEEGMHILSSGNFVEVTRAQARNGASVAPYSAYVKSNYDGVNLVTFSIDEDKATGIDSISADSFNENDVIFNLQGVRVYNPESGLYIVNGKKVMVK